MNKLNIKSSNRLLSLDMFRGFTIASMILVCHPGSWDHVLSQLDHASWHGWTFTDLVFPFFLWIVGVAITLSFKKRIDRGDKPEQILQHVFIRSLILFAIGIFLNGFPFGLFGGHNFSWATIRIPGVLQRIAICYFAASVIFLYSKITWQIIWAILLIVGSWIAIKTFPVPNFGAGILEPAGNLAWYIDTSFLHGHTYIASPAPGFDPEGIFGTLNAIATTLIGILAGHLLNTNKSGHQKTIWMLFSGVAFILLGLAINHWLPINKNLWTSSYTIFTAGMTFVMFAAFYYLVDVKKQQKWFKPLEIYGKNALTIYIVSMFIVRFNKFIHITDATGAAISLKTYYYNAWFVPMGHPMLMSLLHAIAMVLFMYLIAYVLYRIKIIIKA